MIAKKRTLPLHLLKIQALLRRLPPSHKQISLITEDMNKSTAGYKGELAADYYLSLFDQPSRYIFHDLRLPHAHTYFQMDTLYLSPSFALIIEVKNISGTLIFEPGLNQMIRSKDGIKTGFADPILQTD
ncbi:nuclease-related domain-containing protein [Metabacillus mangrovi]|nr:nuclease-related domain-containing protein [Metabacillus mangrovi]